MRNPDTSGAADIPRVAAETLAALRAQAPRVHCITNTVAQGFTANLLLAAGAVPSMTISPGEVGEFVARSDALLVNLGTFDTERRAAIGRAVETAAHHQLPWVLDPVLIDRAPSRGAFARELIGCGPDVVRLNAAEFAALADGEVSPERLSRFAREAGVVAALSGATDVVTDGARQLAIANGSPLMAMVTAMGCAGSALAAACLAVEPDPWRATASALLIIAIAGEIAGEDAAGPGSFAVGILDALYALDAAAIVARARVA